MLVMETVTMEKKERYASDGDCNCRRRRDMLVMETVTVGEEEICL